MIKFDRADPALLTQFDPKSKRCTMNCGSHTDDPRCRAERMLLCDDCETVEPTPKAPDVKMQFDRRGKASPLIAILGAIYQMSLATGRPPSAIRVTQAGFNKLKLDARAFELLVFDGRHHSVWGVRVEIDNSLSSQIDAVCHVG